MDENSYLQERPEKLNYGKFVYALKRSSVNYINKLFTFIESNIDENISNMNFSLNNRRIINRYIVVSAIIRARFKYYELNNINFREVVRYHSSLNKHNFEFMFLDYILYTAYRNYNNNPIYYRHIIVQLAKNKYPRAVFLLGTILYEEGATIESFLKLFYYASRLGCKHADEFIKAYKKFNPYTKEFIESHLFEDLSNLGSFFTEPFVIKSDFLRIKKLEMHSGIEQTDFRCKINMLINKADYCFSEDKFEELVRAYKKIRYDLTCVW